jgi:SAM-dependent methyltransferase
VTHDGYEDLYEEFESPVMRLVREEAYGRDIGQHSWVTVEELDAYIPLLRLTAASGLLDVGCGPAGPLTYIAGRVGCHCFGTDVSEAAIHAGRARCDRMGLEKLVSLQQADGNDPLPFAERSLDGVIALDVVLHLRDRAMLFREVARVLAPGGRFWFTDAGVVTGSVAAEELRLRSIHGYTQFVPAGLNERELGLASLRVVQVEDRTDSQVQNAAGRIAARLAHRDEVTAVEGEAQFEQQLQYLRTVLALAERHALSRIAYVAEAV